jgi:hypothetical protein
MDAMSASHLRLCLDVASVEALVWVATFGRDADLTPEVHRHLFDRYSRLADYHRQRGHIEKARRFRMKADDHHFDDGPPYAAALAMPHARRRVTCAVSPRRLNVPDDAA